MLSDAFHCVHLWKQIHQFVVCGVGFQHFDSDNGVDILTSFQTWCCCFDYHTERTLAQRLLWFEYNLHHLHSGMPYLPIYWHCSKFKLKLKIFIKSMEIIRLPHINDFKMAPDDHLFWDNLTYYLRNNNLTNLDLQAVPVDLPLGVERHGNVIVVTIYTSGLWIDAAATNR